MRLMRTSEITKRPVVTMAGEDVAQLKDVGYSADGGSVGGFTLAALVAVPLGIAMGAWKPVEAVFEPFVSFGRYLPA